MSIFNFIFIELILKFPPSGRIRRLFRLRLPLPAPHVKMNPAGGHRTDAAVPSSVQGGARPESAGGPEEKPVKIYDISQEVFGCAVYPGDPAPERIRLQKMSEGALYNLTAFSMCAHNGTHVDAPSHFIENGETVSQIGLDRFVGYAYVASHEGELSSSDAERILGEAASKAALSRIPGCGCCGRILVKGKAVVTEEAAEVFAARRILLFGNESQTVGPESAPMAVHQIMLGSGIVLLEGIRLSEVKDGIYFLNAAPIHLGQADGAPCRAWLIGC